MDDSKKAEVHFDTEVRRSQKMNEQVTFHDEWVMKLTEELKISSKSADESWQSLAKELRNGIDAKSKSSKAFFDKQKEHIDQNFVAVAALLKNQQVNFQKLADRMKQEKEVVGQKLTESTISITQKLLAANKARAKAVFKAG